MSLRYLSIHAHFYQPPREDPLTGLIPKENGAAPFPNWNERIHAECYCPNAELRNFEKISFNVDVAVEHTPTYYLRLIAGANRSDITTNTYYTLSTLSPPANASTLYDMLHATANVTYSLSRELQFRGEWREELRYTNQPTGDVRARQVTVNFDYRIRMIICNLEYRYREDEPEFGLKTIQQYTYVRISRPF